MLQLPTKTVSFSLQQILKVLHYASFQNTPMASCFSMNQTGYYVCMIIGLGVSSTCTKVCYAAIV